MKSVTTLFFFIFIFSSNFTLSQELIPFNNENGKFGYKDSSGKVIVMPKYDAAFDFKYGFAAVMLKDEWDNSQFGYIDKTGKEVIPVVYYLYSDIEETIIQNVQGHNLGFILGLPKRTFVKKIYKEKYDLTFYEKVDSTQIQKGDSTVFEICDSRGTIEFGIISESGEVLVPFIYDVIQDSKYDTHHVYGLVVRKANKFGILNRDGKIVTPIIYDEINFDFDGHMATQFAKIKLDGKWGMADNKTGKLLVSPKYDDINYLGSDSPNSDTTIIYNINFCKVEMGARFDTVEAYDELKSGSWRETRTLIEGEGDSEKITFVVIGGGKWDIISLADGNEISSVKFDNMHNFFKEGFLAVCVCEKWGFIDTGGKVVVPIIYDRVNDFYEGKAYVILGGKEKYIDKNGNLIED